MVLLQVLFLELVLRFLWNLFTLEEVVIKVLSENNVFTLLAVRTVKFYIHWRHFVSNPLSFSAFLRASIVRLLTSRHAISATHEFADLATTWVADRLQADLASMLLLIVVGALDVGSPVGILGCFDRHLFLLHSDVVNNKNTNSDFYQSWRQSAGYWLTNSFLSTSKW